jgi:hypothetical protein
MNDQEAVELIDAHLDRQSLTDEQSDQLTAWIKEDPSRADATFYRIFLHSYLRMRLQSRLIPEPPSQQGGDYSGLIQWQDPVSTLMLLQESPARGSARRRWLMSISMAVLVVILASVGWWANSLGWMTLDHSDELYVYEGFDYPATPLESPGSIDFKWPTSGGMQDLAGGQGWDGAWQETNSKVAIIVDYNQRDAIPWEPHDMRKFGPVGYSDSLGNVLQSTGNQLRTATSPRSISTRRFDIQKFPESMRDKQGLGRDGSVVWFSFLAQSSLSTSSNNRYSYLIIGSKMAAGLRVGKLGAAPSGNWTAVGMLTGSEVNLKSSSLASGEIVLFVVRIIFRPGPEEVTIWINPPLNAEPAVADSSLRLQVPDFKFDGLTIHANHSTDFDEIRFGNSFRAVTPH